MSIASTQPMTTAEFLAWEERQELRHEFDGSQPMAMTGGTIAHSRIQRNLAISIGGRLRAPCEFLGSDTKLRIDQQIRYPDGLVVRAPRRDDETVVNNPVVIFEVLSQSTAVLDPIVKNLEYQSIATVQRYVMLEQERVAATVFQRRNGDWMAETVGPSEWLRMPEVGVETLLIELYKGLDITAGQETPSQR